MLNLLLGCSIYSELPKELWSMHIKPEKLTMTSIIGSWSLTLGARFCYPPKMRDSPDLPHSKLQKHFVGPCEVLNGVKNTEYKLFLTGKVRGLHIIFLCEFVATMLTWWDPTKAPGSYCCRRQPRV